ncbi:vacuolar protein sorting-associated protein VTA1 homolog isoform X2 [Uloborus diversus]|uniref:vacuolar protein sorting-associated protein VTA1 homolog isoform X2 n=1 Tax=Uloborus diversus TaxID=327109 RepID=UPI00240A9B8B|nr:vacuolar protein sorting-associated protein VTA1 homolog isoform X2 [Uloborus diversus]XP_054720396.1 vacuolar protein sorting-associated protein VTA1 homolog isoform X2 [Uloborus diversus]
MLSSSKLWIGSKRFKKFLEKKGRHDDETIASEVVAQAHIENYALKLFLWADNQDRNGEFNKNVVKAFYTAGFLYDLVNLFGESSEEVAHHRKYAKWKATYIHNCLKNGIVPTPGPVAMEGEDEELSNPNDMANSENTSPYIPQPSQTPYPPGGLFNMPGFQPEGMNLPQPGTHAPPTTPNGSSQISPTASAAEISAEPEDTNSSGLKPEDIKKAQKYCKFVNSALQYEDVPAAIQYLQKALKLLTTGIDD